MITAQMRVQESQETRNWEELRKSESKEAILVHEIDKLELMMQLSSYKEHLSKKSIICTVGCNNKTYKIGIRYIFYIKS